MSNTSFDNVRACVREHQSSERKTEFVYNSQTFTKKQHLWTPANHSHSKTNRTARCHRTHIPPVELKTHHVL